MDLLLQAHNLTKRYGATVALSEADFELRAGEVHALLGSNGSGKSTLSKIVTGLVAPDAGELRVGGQPRRFASPAQARARGIAAVYQELSLVPDMSVQDNLWLGHEIGGLLGINARETARKTDELLALFRPVAGPRFRAQTPVAELAPDERQLVEILKAVGNRPRILILDEATASLGARQVDRLFELVSGWKAEGLGIVIVTHRMEEIFRIADRATVLRNGRVVGSVEMKDTTRAALVGLISGEAKRALQVEAKAPAGRSLPALELSLRAAERLEALELQVYPGEVLGLGGLQGQGQRELLLALFGALTMVGELKVGGRPHRFAHPAEAMRQGLAYVPGDRNREGLLATRSIFENFMLPAWDGYKTGTVLQVERAQKAVIETGERLKLKYGGLELPITSLSGGNAQKVVLGKWLLRHPKVLLLDDPTKGIDVGAKAEFYHLLNDLRAEGMAVIFNSSDEDELLSLCDRVLVMLEGCIVAELSGAALNRAALVEASLGLKGEEGAKTIGGGEASRP
ncbi:MAG: sugar ABC transporter ATP-binding protein [Meiothermus sp.]|nr:sugar ABC transporter ATP-binding protein [Meiothermus sp.]